MSMMSQQPGNDDLGLREELVAYLDGELDAQQSRRIEYRLANEPEVRLVLQELDRTWHLLDELDAPTLDEDFTRTTLEMVAMAAVGDASRTGAKAPRRRWLAAVAGLAAAALAGFALVGRLAPDPNAQLLQDLPLIENLDQYRQIDNLEFLRMLNREKLFTEDIDD